MTTSLDIHDESTLPVLLTVEEAAAVCRVSTKAIYAAAKEGRLPGLRRIGGTIRVHRDTLLGLEGGQR